MNDFSDALVRHLTIDECLRDVTKQNTLISLIEACSKALIIKGNGKIKNTYKVSARTLQLDLQFMRDKKNGYGAPIIVYNQKYYKYKKENYTILNSKLNKDIFSEIQTSIVTLGNFSNFLQLNSTKQYILPLKQSIDLIKSGNENIISSENIGNLKDKDYITALIEAICNKQTLCINYYSTDNNTNKDLVIYPAHLKEYNKHWYILGLSDNSKKIESIKLETINEINYSIIPYPTDFNFNPDEYFNDIIGITKPENEKPVEIKLLIKKNIARLVKNSPLHKSQKIIRVKDRGDMEIELKIIPNSEFYSLIANYHPCIEILSPEFVSKVANGLALDSTNIVSNNVEETPKKVDNLFSNDQILF